MTFALLPRPVRILTGLNRWGLENLLDGLDAESADGLSVELVIHIQQLTQVYRPLMRCPSIVAYLDDLSELCRRRILPSEPQMDHREVINAILFGLLARIRLRMWFLYVDTVLSHS